MQERFALRKTLKKVAAIGTSVAMLGMSLTGALAQEAAVKTLADYPNPFTGSDAVIVIGSDPAANPDNAAATDISFGLGQATAAPAAATGTSTTTTTAPTLVLDDATAYRKDISLGTSLSGSTGLGTNIREVTYPGFNKGTVTLAHSPSSTTNTYSWHEEYNFTNVNAVPATGLTLARVAFNRSSENFKDNIFLNLPSSSVNYEFKFEDTLKTNNMIANSSVTDPYILNFLGKTLIIEGATATSMTALSGERYSGLHVGDTVTVNGKKILVEAIGTSSAALSVDGVTQTISNNNQRSYSAAGLQVRVEDLIATGTSGEGKSSLTVVVGKESAIKTYNSGDNYIGQDKNSPTWIWNLASLDQGTPVIQVKLNPSLISYSSGGDYPDYGLQHPPYTGDLLCLPNNYACLTLESVKQADDSFGAYKISTTSKDLFSTTTSTNAIVSSAQVIAIEAIGQSPDTGLRDSGGTDTGAIYLYGNSSGLWFYRKGTSSSRAITAGGTNFLTRVIPADGTGAMGANGLFNDPSLDSMYNTSMFTINYKSSSVPVDVRYSNNSRTIASYSQPGSTSAVLFNNLTSGTLRINPSGANNEVLLAFQYDSSGSLSYLGNSQGETTTANDLTFRNNIGGTTGVVADGIYLTDISGYKQKTRTPDGIIVGDYGNSDSADELKFWVPPDISNYKVWVKLAKPKGGSTSGGSVVAGSSSSGPAVKKDTEVLKDLANWNVVSVGGPAVNQVTAKVLGLTFPAYGAASGLNPNEAVVELKANGSKWALLAYGWESDNTRAAGLVLRNYKDFAAKLKGTKVTVKHTSLAVSGITVEA